MNAAEQKLLDRLLSDTRIGDTRWVAYIMATVKHETNSTFEPVEEAYWLSERWRAENLRYYPWHGRGFVQITWKSNYEQMSYRLDLPGLAADPDTALKWDVAYDILVVGMIEGLFTGKDLDDFINEDRCDYRHARKIVNGMDRAEIIAEYAREYEQQISDFSPVSFTIDDSPAKRYDGKYAYCMQFTWSRDTAGQDIGNCVRLIQRALNNWLESRDGEAILLDVDGVFGPQTERTVHSFQMLHYALRIDGVVGPKTWAALEQYLS